MPNPLRPTSPADGESSDAPRATVGDRLEQFERRQRQLWRLTYFLLSLFTIAYVAVSWDAIRSFARRFDYLLVAGPLPFFIVSPLFCVTVVGTKNGGGDPRILS